MDTLLVLALGVTVVAYLIACIHPKTRPYALKLWWVPLSLGGVLIGALLGRQGDWGDDADSVLVDMEDRAKEHTAREEAEQRLARAESADVIEEGEKQRAAIGEMTDRDERLKAYAKMGRR